MRAASAFSLLALAATALAVDLGVPLSWREFSDNKTKAQHISISKAGIDQITPQLVASTANFNGIGYWQSGNVFSAMANHDHFAGTTTYKTTVLNGLNTAFSKYAHYDQFGYNDDAMWWATAAYYAYRAYGDTTVLNHAIDTWTHVSNYVVKNGKAPGKSFTPAATCNGKTMDGGVFWRPTADDTGINSITTGLYLTLSAFLATTTSANANYVNAAITSVNWIRNQNLNSEGLVLDSVNGKDCSRPNTWLFTYNQGKTIEGLAVLYDVTKDSQWSDWLTSLVNAAVKSKHWEGDDGVITEGASPSKNNDGVGFKSVFVRALNEVFVRTTIRDLNILIHSYLDVQYNALLELASTGNNIYSSAWHGPPQSFTTWGQMAALDVIVSAISANT
ncbi:glycoside hydrolase [Irpex rosettiformis]|uniref:Glycoside hydrolase n=1 Tax=Irpex rosettiformis TaxID=378272 RepID=A0ACB8UKB5_9APHY|nr:glycoside hydrolase [Irpex rosettiformis]